jgi:methyl-accepting chemotaxis protein
MKSLQDYLSKGPVLLAFHRGTWCPNCRRKFGELAQHSREYVARGMQVVTVVAQTSDAVRRYVEDAGLPFNILIDESRDVLKAYGVWHRLGLDAWNIARPALFVIDRSGNIRYSFVSQHQDEFPTHEDIMKEIDKLEAGRSV